MQLADLGEPRARWLLRAGDGSADAPLPDLLGRGTPTTYRLRASMPLRQAASHSSSVPGMSSYERISKMPPALRGGLDGQKANSDMICDWREWTVGRIDWVRIGGRVWVWWGHVSVCGEANGCHGRRTG